MSKKTPTPEDEEEEQMYLSMREFSFFGKNENSYLRQIRGLLDSGHTLSLYMTQSTSLSNDLYKLNMMLSSKYEMNIRFRADEYDQAQVIVNLTQREVSA
jgi:hypothetical protein